MLGCLLPLATAYSQNPAPEAMAEVTNLNTQFGVPIIGIPAVANSYTLIADYSLNIGTVLTAGTPLQPNPPALGAVPTYPVSEQDGVPAGTPPPYISQYVSQTFQFNYFSNRFDYGGPNRWPTKRPSTSWQRASRPALALRVHLPGSDQAITEIGPTDQSRTPHR
jgi:hypothetical protein